MRRRVRLRRPSPGMVVALLALGVALGGTSYAAVSLPKNSVGAAQLKKGAVTSLKIRNSAVTAAKIKPGSLLAKNFKPGELPVGPRGPAGAPGPTGPPGPQGPAGADAASLWGIVDISGGLGNNRGALGSSRDADGQYTVLWSRVVTGCAFSITPVSGGGGQGVDVTSVSVNANQLTIQLRDYTNSTVNRMLHVVAFC